MLYEYNYEKPELSETYLEHHGVQGQKWGVRNGPPYPLSRQKKGNGRLVGKITINKKKDKHDDYYFTHKTPKYVQPIPGIKLKNKRDYSLREDVLAVNPHFEESDKYQNNCLYCTLTMEMRCRGYDVQAQPVNKKYNDYAYADTLEELGNYNGLFVPRANTDFRYIPNKSNNEEISTKPTKKQIEQLKNEAKSILNDMPVNARGEISVYYYWDDHNDGHSVFFEKLSDNRVVIIDAQSSDPMYFDTFDLWDYSSSIAISRFDNCDIDINKVKDFCK